MMCSQREREREIVFNSFGGSFRFGWSMLLVLSAPPSNVDIIDFTDNGVKGALAPENGSCLPCCFSSSGFLGISCKGTTRLCVACNVN